MCIRDRRRVHGDDFMRAKTLTHEEATKSAIVLALHDLTILERAAAKNKDNTEDLNEEYMDSDRSLIRYNENGDYDNEKILRYNDDLEELNSLGIFKYVVYPFKVIIKACKDSFNRCRRPKEYQQPNKQNPDQSEHELQP
eukprot:TRINITY_DN7562_c0_g1_i1.p1 TRINITY_DN7562_c0_g1~~TRINITY_DN7562_c0_g1_i1.p1  ORF type:complete len:159 (-),score=61.43 TRINITY_DN7562_c0_g1_i1:360-779(-)